MRPLYFVAALAVALALVVPTSFQSASAVTPVKTVTTPFFRGNGSLNHMRLDPKGRFVAFVGDDGTGLSVLDIKSKSIWKVSSAQVGPSFFWAPDGFRLFYRELGRGVVDKKVAKPNQVKSTLKAFDAFLNRSITLEEMPYQTGLLTFDPRDLRMHLISEKGIRTKRIYFPDERLAKWQVAQRSESGKFLATQGGMLWVTQGGYAMRRLEDDASRLESFDVSPEGQAVAWATQDGRIYTSQNGKPPVLVGHGRDPQWHPTKPLLLFAGARMVGNKAVSFDLRITDVKGHGKFLTSTQHSDERWPQWHPKGNQILYTVGRSTDVYLLDFKF